MKQTKKMKQFFVILFACMGTFSLYASDNIAFRYTYLWDVTYSMYGGYGKVGNEKSEQKHPILGERIVGYNPKYDIFECTRNTLISDIRSLKEDAKSEIIVIPFEQEKDAVWRVLATKEGKEEIINRISSYHTCKRDWTYMASPLQYVIDNIFTKDKIDVVKLMTDGTESWKDHQGDLVKIMEHWCDMATEMNVFGYYVMLTDKAKSGNLEMVIKQQCRINLIAPGTELNFNMVRADDRIDCDITKVNTPITICVPMQLVNGSQFPQNMSIRFTADNAYFALDEVCELNQQGYVELHPQYKMAWQNLRQDISSHKGIATIYINMEKSGGSEENQLLSDQIAVNLINKSLKKVSITLE